MAKIHVYLNFNGNCEEAFQFYASVFKTTHTGIMRYGDMPSDPEMPTLNEQERNKVLHMAIKLDENTMLMGSDISEVFGQTLSYGNSTYITLTAESADEARTLFNALKQDAQLIEMDLEETFFAELFSSLQDKYGIYWMIDYAGNKMMN